MWRPWTLLLLLFATAGCIQIGDVFPYRLLDDDDSAANDDDAADDDDSGDDDDSTPCDLSWIEESEDDVSLAFQLEPIFGVNCAPCHTVQDLGGLQLNPGVSFKQLVGVPNLLGYGDGADAMPRVTAGDPQQSYLLHKLVGCGPNDPDWGHFQSEMPPPVVGTIPLSEAETSLVWSWVLQGAANN